MTGLFIFEGGSMREVACEGDTGSMGTGEEPDGCTVSLPTNTQITLIH
jgi:hypothetical protein